MCLSNCFSWKSDNLSPANTGWCCDKFQSAYYQDQVLGQWNLYIKNDSSAVEDWVWNSQAESSESFSKISPNDFRRAGKRHYLLTRNRRHQRNHQQVKNYLWKNESRPIPLINKLCCLQNVRCSFTLVFTSLIQESMPNKKLYLKQSLCLPVDESNCLRYSIYLHQALLHWTTSSINVWRYPLPAFLINVQNNFSKQNHGNRW